MCKSIHFLTFLSEIINAFYFYSKIMLAIIRNFRVFHFIRFYLLDKITFYFALYTLNVA